MPLRRSQLQLPLVHPAGPQLVRLPAGLQSVVSGSCVRSSGSLSSQTLAARRYIPVGLRVWLVSVSVQAAAIHTVPLECAQHLPPCERSPATFSTPRHRLLRQFSSSTPTPVHLPRGSTLPAPTSPQVPSARSVQPIEHATHCWWHLLSQHLPSVQKPDAHSVSPLQTAPLAFLLVVYWHVPLPSQDGECTDDPMRPPRAGRP